MVVNTEWGAFGDNGELDYVKTKWDEEVKVHVEGIFLKFGDNGELDYVKTKWDEEVKNISFWRQLGLFNSPSLYGTIK